jgi:hypothetical protein
MSSVSAYSPPLRGRMVWKDADEVRVSQVDIVAVVTEGRSDVHHGGAWHGDRDDVVYFIGATRDTERRTVWAYAEDTTFEFPENYR